MKIHFLHHFKEELMYIMEALFKKILEKCRFFLIQIDMTEVEKNAKGNIKAENILKNIKNQRRVAKV